MCGIRGGDVLYVPTVGCNITTVVATRRAKKLEESKYEATELLLEVKIW